MTEQEMREMLVQTERRITTQAKKTINVCGKDYEICQITASVRGKIDELNQEVYRYEQMMKQAITPKMARIISRKMYSLHAKIAACYLLGEKIWLIRPSFLLFAFPYLDGITGLRYWLKWRKINHLPSEVAFKICEGAMNDEDLNFSLASWQITKAQLALSTKLIGEGISEYQKRMESAKQQVEKDGTPISQEDKSDVSSKPVRKTKK